VETAAAALITNVASDHLGEYGINTVEDLAEAKFIVRKALKGNAPLILNADDERSVAQATKLEDEFRENAATRMIWFSLDTGTPVIEGHLASSGRAVCFSEGWIEIRQAGNARRIVKTGDIPATMEGAARHNISNALAAVALCRALGIEDGPLKRGMMDFRGDESDNPGRGNWFEHDGVRILVDFAHNVHGMTALADMIGSVEASRRVLMMGQAGDRADDDIRDLVRVACAMSPDRILISEMPGYERGREPGVVPGLIRQTALEAGVDAGAISLYDSPVAAVEYALEDARAGDLLIFLALTQREEVLERIHRFVGQ
jgi:UDP-N-acetylmuramyl tripeptide synthase